MLLIRYKYTFCIRLAHFVQIGLLFFDLLHEQLLTKEVSKGYVCTLTP